MTTIYIIDPPSSDEEPYVFANAGDAERFAVERFDDGDVTVIRATVIDHHLAERMIAEERDDADEDL